MTDAFTSETVEQGTNSPVEFTPSFDEVIEVQPQTSEVLIERPNVLLAVGETINEQIANEVFSRHGAQIKATIASTTEYLEGLFDAQGVADANIHVKELGPDDLTSWNQGQAYFRSDIDKAAPVAYLTYQNDMATGGISVWFDWDTGQVFTEIDEAS